MPTKSLTFQLTAYQSQLRQRPHTHDALQISVVMRGRLRECVGKQVEYAGALSVVVKDPGVTHADEFQHDGALIARLAVHGAELRDLVEHSERADAWRWSHDLVVAAPFLRIVERGSRGQGSFAADDDDVVDLIAALSARAATTAASEPPAWLRDVVTTIDEAWHPDLRSRDLARAAGVHPVYLARCVRRWYHMSLGDRLRRARLRCAVRAVAAGRETVSAVAHASGFADEAHLCRVFARASGVAPGRFRRLVRACDAAAIGAAPGV